MSSFNGFTDADVGVTKVMVLDRGEGVVMFVGMHVVQNLPRIGVMLNEPAGLNNGTIGGHQYFKCEESHGVLVDPSKVKNISKEMTFAKASPAATTAPSATMPASVAKTVAVAAVTVGIIADDGTTGVDFNMPAFNGFSPADVGVTKVMVFDRGEGVVMFVGMHATQNQAL